MQQTYDEGEIERATEEARYAIALVSSVSRRTGLEIRDDLMQLWDYRYPAAARRFWKVWYSRAVRSRIQPLKRFAQRLKPYFEGILAHCRWPLSTGLLEGMNNKIKVIKRMAYGFRDDAYFFLKIRAAFPGITG